MEDADHIFNLQPFSVVLEKGGVSRNCIGVINLLVCLSALEAPLPRVENAARQARSAASNLWKEHKGEKGLEGVLSVPVPYNGNREGLALTLFKEVEILLDSLRKKNRTREFFDRYGSVLQSHLGTAYPQAPPTQPSVSLTQPPVPSTYSSAPPTQSSCLPTETSALLNQPPATSSQPSAPSTQPSAPFSQPSVPLTQSLPACYSLLTNIRFTTQGFITATAKDYAVFLDWLRQIQDITHTEFCVSEVRGKEPMKRVFSCKHGRRADFKARQLKNERKNHSTLLLGCTSTITVHVHEDANEPVQLILQMKHTNHSPGAVWEVPELGLHPRVVDLIYEAVSIGQSATEMTTRLFVDIKKLCAELKVPADRRNARFFPSADVIRRVAAKQLTKLRAHQVDHISVDMWLASLPPEVIWFWRKSSAGIELLLILQTAAMRERLLLYGGDIVLADSTYKTQLYNLPLFILCVIDNHGRGYPVAFVLVESESTIMLAEALQW